MSRVVGGGTEGKSPSSQDGVGSLKRDLTRSEAVEVAAPAMSSMSTPGVNVERGEATPAELGAALSPSTPEEEKEGGSGGKNGVRRFGVKIRRRTPATTALAKAKAVSAKSRPDPTEVIKTSSERIVGNARHFQRVSLPTGVTTGNVGGSKTASALSPKTGGTERHPKESSPPTIPQKIGSGSSASELNHGVRVLLGLASLNAPAYSSAASAALLPYPLSYSHYKQQLVNVANQLQSSQNNLPWTPALPSTSVGVGVGLTSLTSSLHHHHHLPSFTQQQQSTILNLLSPSTVIPSTPHMATPRKPGNVPIPPVAVEPPQPPNFQQHLDETLMSLSTHKKFPIDKHSMEFRELEQLLSPLNVTSAEQIANPDLWQRFITARKEMLRTKSSDLNILSKLFPFDKDVLKAAQLSLKFNKDPQLTTEQGKYSPNEALLFHCVKDPNNMESILTQGLGERLGKHGLFGKGIYFSDDPMKSSSYDRSGGIILVFAVLLGDCLHLSYQSRTRSSFVREPEKKREQMRSFNDKFFDSITSSVTGGHNDNEYIIYNRYQCCPLYLVKYNGKSGSPRGMPPYCGARLLTPSIAWLSDTVVGGSSMAMPDQSRDGSWPFFAESIFRRMGVSVPQIASGSSADVKEQNQKIKCLVSIGFPDEDLNRRAVRKYGNDLNKAVEFLMEHAKSQPQPSTSKLGLSNGKPDPKVELGKEYNSSLIWKAIVNKMTTPTTGSSSSPKKNEKGNSASPSKTVKDKGRPTTTAVVTLDSSREDKGGQPNAKKGKFDMELCDICYTYYAPFEKSPELWKELKCSHRLCLKCHNRIETTRSTMAGVSHTFVKCPFCQGVSGIEVGTCPVGKMQMEIIDSECSGYPLVKTIHITYDISTGQHNLRRIAYLPYNREGHGIMKLLETAWDRRICFMIGTSMTTGKQNVPVWNIHHKTSTKGGPQSYGYPDPGYFQRVRAELKAYGIE